MQEISTFQDGATRTVFQLLAEVEEVIDSRPLTSNPESPLDQPPLTPNDLIKIGSSLRHEPGVFKPGDFYVSRWRHIMHLSQEWWRRWQREYLPLLHRQTKWLDERDNLQVGDFVLLMGEQGTHRHDYPLGRILEVYPGEDGLVRNVKLMCREKIYKRPVNKLCKLEGILYPGTQQ